MTEPLFPTYEVPLSYPITLPIWDIANYQMVYVTKSLNDWIINPGTMNVEMFGIHILNCLRMARNLPPISIEPSSLLSKK